MRQAALLLTALLLTQCSLGQTQDVWVRFYDTITERSGYQDLKGTIKIPAKFSDFTRADTFYHIIAAAEIIDNSRKHYYLLKDGRKVAQDSVFVFDYTYDCESEGKIIFKDWKKDRVGFLDKNGTAIIPAIYNYVSPFRNGIAIAHRNAKRKCWDEGGDTTNCEHLGWQGGETILINKKNEILADSLNIDLNKINWYSKRINDPSVDTSIYVNIKGKNGSVYSFIDHDKEFRKWFNNTFLQALQNNGTLQDLLFDEVTYWSRKNGWTSLEKSVFLKFFPDALTTKRFEPNNMKEVSMSQDSFNTLIFDKDIYKKYLDACGEHNKDRFPLYEVYLTYYKKRQKPLAEDVAVKVAGGYVIDYQEHFQFLKTEKGYRLLKVALKR